MTVPTVATPLFSVTVAVPFSLGVRVTRRSSSVLLHAMTAPLVPETVAVSVALFSLSSPSVYSAFAVPVMLTVTVRAPTVTAQDALAVFFALSDATNVAVTL